MSGEATAGPFTIADDLSMRPSPKFGDRLRKIGTMARQNPLGTIGLIIIVVFAITAVFAPAIAPYAAGDLPGTKNESPSAEFWFGTNRSGQDIFSRVVLGTRISLTVAFLSVIGGATIGMLIGIISGYMGGATDSVIQRTVDTAIAFPALLLLLILTQADPFETPADWLHINKDYATIIFALTLAVIPGVARVVRGAVLSEKNNQYVEAARSIGATSPRILLRHVLPNVLALGIIVMTSLLGGIILAEAALSFLGLGIPGAASWGLDVNTARQMLWLPTSREEKYKAKQAADTFIVRVGDLLSAGLVYVGTTVLGFASVDFSLVNVIVCVLWLGESLMYAAEYIGDGQRRALPLINDGIHDWYWLLTQWGMLGAAETLGTLVHLLASGVVIAALAMAWQALREEAVMQAAHI